MKKLIITSIIGLVLILGVAAVAVAINSSSDRPAASDSRTAISNKRPAVSSNSVESPASNPNFISAGLEVKELDESKIDTATAIQKAKEVAGDDVTRQGADVTAVRVRLTDKVAPELYLGTNSPKENIVLKDYPVWIVTFHRVTLLTNHGPALNQDGTINKNVSTNDWVLADENEIIDANSGEWLTTISCGVK
ncbi:MAG TPA: hypothetical protein VE439_07820 [Anaerolineae bacterium]|nr:hypothetical protein [Anaerolineae bacterium]